MPKSDMQGQTGQVGLRHIAVTQQHSREWEPLNHVVVFAMFFVSFVVFVVGNRTNWQARQLE